MAIKILVNGASGFIGSSFLEEISKNNKFSVFATFHKTYPKKRIANVKYIKADLSSKSECEKIVKGIDYVAMFAGNLSTFATFQKRPLGYVPETTVITLNMLDAANSAGIKKFLWLSSTTGYPQSVGPLTEDQFHQGMPQKSCFSVGIMSRYLEHISEEYANKNNSFTVIAIRPACVYGPGDDFELSSCHVLPAMIRKVADNHNPIEIWGDGEHRKDWLYIDDLVQACILSLENLSGFNAINISSGQGFTVNQILDALSDINSTTIERKYIDINKKGAKGFELDHKLAEEKLGFFPKTLLKEGIMKTLKWYKENKLLVQSS